MKNLLGLMTYLVATSVWANWQLDNEHSHLSFVSVKKSQIAESHHFTALAGTIKNNQVTFSIDLASVETAIPIRNERMAKFLFDTETYPKATFSATLPADLISSMNDGDIKHFALTGKLSIREQSKDVNVNTMIVKAGNKLVVSSEKPMLIKASDYDLVNGVKKLAELASLPSITETVPVSFTLTFSH